MRFCLNTDCLGYMPFEEMLDTVAALGYESIEIACGNWSQAPHIDLDAMLASEETRKNFMDAIEKPEIISCERFRAIVNYFAGSLRRSINSMVRASINFMILLTRLTR